MVVLETCSSGYYCFGRVLDCVGSRSSYQEDDEEEELVMPITLLEGPEISKIVHNPLADKMVDNAMERAKMNTLQHLLSADRDDDDLWLERRMVSAPKRPADKNQERCQTPIPVSLPVELETNKGKKSQRSRPNVIQPRSSRPVRATLILGGMSKSKPNSKETGAFLLTPIGEEKILADKKQSRWLKKKSKFIPDVY
jgi:hypothetical protein